MRAALCLAAFLAAGVAAAQAPTQDYAVVQQLMRDGRAAQALAHAQQYLEANPRDPQMRFLRGVVLAETGRTAEAIEAYTRLTQDYPELPEPYNNLAVLFAAQDELDKARTALEMALRANPQYAAAHANLGDIHLRLAVRSYQRAAQLEPSNAALPSRLAAVRALVGAAPPPVQREGRAAPPSSP
ncbi:tetratricopeptide repeat protein [Ramlibacter sp. AN1015]|uniref:tetratricopeptide repeat protein n=1 Tax=Ramlibacter sp. AN1015 TaxID=3133428 RepID=UPI0030BC62B5